MRGGRDPREVLCQELPHAWVQAQAHPRRDGQRAAGDGHGVVQLPRPRRGLLGLALQVCASVGDQGGLQGEDGWVGRESDWMGEGGRWVSEIAV